MLSITIPVYLSTQLHVDFTQECLDSIHTKHQHHIFIIVNHAKPKFQPYLKELTLEKHISVINNPSGNILSAAWNLGIKSSIFTSEVAASNADSSDGRTPPTNQLFLIINNDIVFHPQAIDTLVQYADKHPKYLLVSGSEWPNLRTLDSFQTNHTSSPHPHFSCFVISQKTIDKVGFFDENFGFGYFEDNDYHLRILLSDHQAQAIDAAKFYHYGSRTIKADDSLKLKAQKHYHLNRAYFKKKWGIDIHGQAFDPPETILKKSFKRPFNNPNKSVKDW